MANTNQIANGDSPSANRLAAAPSGRPRAVTNNAGPNNSARSMRVVSARPVRNAAIKSLLRSDRRPAKTNPNAASHVNVIGFSRPETAYSVKPRDPINNIKTTQRAGAPRAQASNSATAASDHRKPRAIDE